MSEPNPILRLHSATVTVRALVEHFLDEKRALRRVGSIGDEYLDRLVEHLTDLSGAHGDLPAHELRPSVARQWLCAHKTWKSPHTLENAYRSLRTLMRWAEAEELVDKNPLRALKRFWQPPQPRGACRPEEYAAIMRAARTAKTTRNRVCPARVRMRFQLWFLWHSGCRTCELREALWEQVDWQRGLLVMSRGKSTRSTGVGRVIPLTDNVVRVLRWLWRRRHPEQKHIFCARGGQPIKRKSWDRTFRRYARLAGVRKQVTLYTLRHGFCVAGLTAGLGDSELAEIMGHTTTKYIRWYGRDLREHTEHLRASADCVHKPRQKHKDDPKQGSLF